MMKRWIGIVLALCLALALAACGDAPKAPAATQAPAATKAPAAATEAPKERISKKEIAEAIDKAETAADLQALIDAMEGVYGEDEEIELGGDTITLARIREMQALFAAIEGGGDAPGSGAVGTPVSTEAMQAVGEWTGVYTKFVGDTDGVTDTPFSLTLNDDGTAVSRRDDMDYAATWGMDGGEITMTETFMGMTIDYNGMLEDGVLHLFNGDREDDFTCEYVYGRGDVSGIEIPRGETDNPALGRFRGDWNGALLFRSCTGKYEYLDGSTVGAVARFAVQSDGSIQPFIGIDVEDTPFVDLTASYSDFWEELTISGSWINVPFEGIAVRENNGTLSVVIPIAKEAGSLEMVMNFRRLDDEGWTDEVPRLDAKNIEYCKGKTFGGL